MIKIAICDDEPIQLKLLEQAVTEWVVSRKNEYNLELCKNAAQFLFLWDEKKDIDILLLDIEMPDMDGVSLAKELRKRGEKLQIVFVTCNPDFVFEGYDVDAVSYLLKPVNRERLNKALDKAAEKMQMAEPVIFIECTGETQKIYLKDIYYVESDAHDAVIYSTAKDPIAKYREGIASLEKNFNGISNAFFRMHRSYIINLAHISRITKKDVFLENDTTLPIARNKWEELNRAYIRYYRGMRNE